MFSNECLGVLQYEATTAVIVIAGIMLSCLSDYIGNRILLRRISKIHVSRLGPQETKKHGGVVPSQPSDKPEAFIMTDNMAGHARLKVVILDAGIVFHSLRMYLLRPSHLTS